MSETLTEEAVAPATADDTATEAGGETAPAAAATVETAPAVATEPEINWNDLAFWNEVQQRAQTMGLALTVPEAPAATAAPEEPQFLDEYGQLDPRAFQEFLAARDQRLVEQLTQRTAPIEQFVQQQEADRVTGLVNADVQAVMTAAGVAETELPLVRLAAQQFATDPDVVRHGATSAGVRAATQKAVDWLAARDKATGEKAVEAYKTSLTDGGSTLLEPGVRGAGVEGGREYADEIDLARHYRFNRA